MDSTMGRMDDSLGQEWLRNWLPRLRFGATFDHIIDRFASQEASASALSELLSANPLFESAVLAHVRERMYGKEGAKEMQEHKAGDGVVLTTHRCVELLGVLGTRNVVATLRQVRSMGDPWPFDRNSAAATGGNAASSPAKGRAAAKRAASLETDSWLKFSLLAQDFCQTHQIVDPEAFGFAAGGLFDWLRNTATRQCKKTQNVEKAAEEFYQRSLKYAFVAARLAERTPGFGYGKFAFSAGMALGAGRLALHYLSLAPNGVNSAWLDFEKGLEKIPEVSRGEVRALRERSLGSFAPEFIAGMILVQSEIMRGMAPALRNVRTPYYLEAHSRELYHFASLLWLALRIVEHNRALESAKQPLVEWLNKKWIRSLGIRERFVLEAAKEATSLR